MGRSYIHLAVQERALIETQLRLGMSPVAILLTRVLFVPLCEHCSLPPLRLRFQVYSLVRSRHGYLISPFLEGE